MNGSLRGVPVSREPIWLASKFPTAVKGYRHEIDPLDAQVLTSLSLAAAIAQPTAWGYWVPRLPEIEKNPASRAEYMTGNWRPFSRSSILE